MTSHVARLYAIAVSLVVFFVAWSAVAARPWATPKPDPRLAALALREQRLQARSIVVKRQLDRRWAIYRSALASRQKALAAAPPPVRVVNLPPLTITRTS